MFWCRAAAYSPACSEILLEIEWRALRISNERRQLTGVYCSELLNAQAAPQEPLLALFGVRFADLVRQLLSRRLKTSLYRRTSAGPTGTQG
jgi:hypothetical protein